MNKLVNKWRNMHITVVQTSQTGSANYWIPNHTTSHSGSNLSQCSGKDGERNHTTSHSGLVLHMQAYDRLKTQYRSNTEPEAVPEALETFIRQEIRVE